MSASDTPREYLYFSVPDMGPCYVEGVEKTLSEQEGIESVEVDAIEKLVCVRLKENQEKVNVATWKEAINTLGYELNEPIVLTIKKCWGL